MRRSLKAFLQKIPSLHLAFIIVNVVLVLLCVVSALGLRFVSTAAQTTTAADRFRGESDQRFAQLACFFPVGGGKAKEDIWSFRQSLESRFVEESLTAPEGGSLFIDAYSSSAAVTVSTDHAAAEITAWGVGGDFFYFHPLRLRSGSYIDEDDLMDDLVVLDEALAWRLFGGTELTGMTLSINGKPFVVSGVVAMEGDFASGKVLSNTGSLFLSYSALNKLQGSTLVIDCYEAVLPDPINGYACSIMADSMTGGEIIENSGRFTLSRLWERLESFGERSMRTTAVVYPYWENALRLTEDYAALLLVLVILFALCPVLTCSVLSVWGIVLSWRWVKRAVPEKLGAVTERRLEKRLLRDTEKNTEGV